VRARLSPNLATGRSKLLARIHRRYQTVETEITIASSHLRFTRIADPDVVLDEVAQAEEDRAQVGTSEAPQPLHLPYWAELWDSAIGICQYISSRSGEFTDRSTLDLGCGMGLAGCFAAQIGARVCLADIVPDALLFARLNSLPCASSCRIRRIDWRTDTLDERFDVILGADILYERSQWEFLEPFWRLHLSPTGRILLGEPGRQTGDLFIPWIQSKGWTLAQHTETVPTRTVPIRLFELNPKP
jgi:predicted nicotinamide N-methyase